MTTGEIIAAVVIVIMLVLAAPFCYRAFLASIRGANKPPDEAVDGKNDKGGGEKKVDKGGCNKFTVFVVLAVAIASIWWLTSYYNESEISAIVADITKEKNIQPAEEWVFEWRLPPGEMRIGRNSHTLEAVIIKNNENSLWVILHDRDNSGRDVSVGDLHLSKIGNDLIGTWTNYLDGDGGKCYLYKNSNNSWSGHEDLKDGSHIDCMLKRK